MLALFLSPVVLWKEAVKLAVPRRVRDASASTERSDIPQQLEDDGQRGQSCSGMCQLERRR